MVMSSRYVAGGATDNRLRHYTISKMGGYYLSTLLRINIKDFSTGYQIIKKDLWNAIKDYHYSKKNIFLIESIYFAHKYGAKLGEIPIFLKSEK